MTTLHFVVPQRIDDPRRPSGGNVYDRKVAAGLTSLGWRVVEHPVGGPADLDAALQSVRDGSLVLVDGLVLADPVVPHAGRLRLIALLHMPMELPTSSTVVATSAWTRQWLIDRDVVASNAIHVVEPGTDPAELAAGTPTGGELLCVGAVTTGKGHDVLIEALATLRDLLWRCTCVGALDLEPGYVDGLSGSVRDAGLDDRIRFTGPLTGPALAAAYAGADLLVSASRAESYGMVLSEALARGLPVVAADVGGVSEALGRADDERPGVLVPPDNPAALAAALRDWLGDAGHRDRLRRTASARRETLPDWLHTSERLASVLAKIT